ncbi:lipocalin family protein [Thermomonas sp.]|uniref:lipocalin family protein n=1 Tax=Thermomonas sp. TaxID=1971895 RepID=UPI002C16775A|nr:lipocalin family protein [Thermomonas sp.]HRO62912.1 lipocalin family protein [Thermomonas sp.]
MKSMRIAITTLLALPALTACAGARAPVPTLAHVDLQRLMGRWYVIGIIPTRLERGNHNPVETYRLDRNGNVCTWYRYRGDGFDSPVKLLQSTGLVVPGTGNAEWKVRFFGLFKAQYKVGWLAPDYSQVLIVRDARDYLWYMARTPTVPDSDYLAMLARAGTLGYDVSRIERVPQRWPETGAGRDTFHGDCQ